MNLNFSSMINSNSMINLDNNLDLDFSSNKFKFNDKSK